MSEYGVKQGDTLWNIAERLLGDGQKWNEIQRANGLRTDQIQPGQILRIPGAAHNTAYHGTTNHRTASDGTSSHDTTSISKDEFKKALTSNGYPAQSEKYNDFIQSCSHAKIRTKDEAAMYLATLLHESDGLRVTEENYNPVSIQAYGRYIGRGYIQLSSRENYEAMSNRFNIDYVNNPEWVSVDPHAWNVSACYWKDQVHQHVHFGFRRAVELGIRPLESNFPRRESIYGKVCEAFNVRRNL